MGRPGTCMSEAEAASFHAASSSVLYCGKRARWPMAGWLVSYFVRARSFQLARVEPTWSGNAALFSSGRWYQLVASRGRCGTDGAQLPGRGLSTPGYHQDMVSSFLGRELIAPRFSHCRPVVGKMLGTGILGLDVPIDEYLRTSELPNSTMLCTDRAKANNIALQGLRARNRAGRYPLTYGKVLLFFMLSIFPISARKYQDRTKTCGLTWTVRCQPSDTSSRLYTSRYSCQRYRVSS